MTKSLAYEQVDSRMREQGVKRALYLIVEVIHNHLLEILESEAMTIYKTLPRKQITMRLSHSNFTDYNL